MSSTPLKSPYIKGQPGYQNHHKRMYGLISLVGFLIIIAVFTISYIYTGTARNYFNILSVLVLLPTVKFFVQYVMLPWKNKVDPTEWAEFNQLTDPVPMYCELVITGAEKHFDVVYIYITPQDHLIAYSCNPKNNPDLFKKAVTNFMNHYNWSMEVTLFLDLRDFKARLNELAPLYKEATNEQLAHVAEVFNKLSIMSV